MHRTAPVPNVGPTYSAIDSGGEGDPANGRGATGSRYVLSRFIGAGFLTRFRPLHARNTLLRHAPPATATNPVLHSGRSFGRAVCRQRSGNPFDQNAGIVLQQFDNGILPAVFPYLHQQTGPIDDRRCGAFALQLIGDDRIIVLAQYLQSILYRPAFRRPALPHEATVRSHRSG